MLGGTGSIGGPVVRELIRAGHDVVALVRSEASAKTVAQFGARPIPGDIVTPERWLGALPPLDAVIHAAAAFDGDDEAAERRLLERLLNFLRANRQTMKFIYTGGCWLYGVDSGSATTEETPFDPLPAFAWGVSHSRLVLDTPGIHPIVIHPAMVYEAGGGVFDRFRRNAVERDAVRVVGDERVRWPLVHSEDLATLYRLALERSGPRETYIGAAIEGLPVGRIARAYARRFETRQDDPDLISADQREGAGTSGLATASSRSGGRDTLDRLSDGMRVSRRGISVWSRSPAAQ